MNPDTPLALFSDLLAASWRAGWLIVVIVALRFVVRERISAQVWFAAWIVVALRLLLPFSVPAAWSPYNLSGAAAPPTMTTVAPLPAVGFTVAPNASTSTSTPASALPPAQVAVAQPVVAPRAWAPREILGVIWIAGVAGLFAVRLVAGMSFRRRLRMARPLGDMRVREMLVREGGAAAGLVVLETDAVDAPALYGLVRPRLLFPRGLVEMLNDAELRHVVRHELAHWRRRDLLAQGLMQAAVALHWFNPLAWLGARLARADCELACDEFVLRREAADDGAAAYGATLLKVLGMVGRGRRPSSVVAMLEGREQLAHRVRLIADYRPVGAGRVLAGVLLIAGLAVASLTRESRADDATAASPAASAIAPVATPGSETDRDSSRELLVVIDEQKKRVQSLEQELAAHKERNGLTSLDQRKDAVNAALKAANQELLRAGQVVAAAEIRINQIKDYRARRGDLLTLPFVAGQPIVARLMQELATRKIELVALQERYGDRHPHMITAQNIIAETEKALKKVVDDTCDLIEADYNAGLRGLEQARVQLARRTQESIELDRAALGLNDKQREVRNQENILQTLQQRQLDFVGAGGSTGGGALGRAAGDFSISVMGAVNQQGAIGFTAADKPVVLEVIARSGGFTELADRSRVHLIRANADGTRTTFVLTEADLMSGTGPRARLQRGDVVVVPTLPMLPASTDSRRVSVLGQVTSPGSYPMPLDGKLTLVELLAQAGGHTRLANLKLVRITRVSREGEKKVFTINVDGFVKGDDLMDFVIEPGDIVFVPERIL